MMQLLLRALVIGVLAQVGFPVLKGPYLGQKRPGPAPEIFAPGIVSLGFHEHNIAISPDGREIFFVTASADFSRYLIMTTREENGAWTMPEVAPFSGGRNDGAPSFSPDGKRLYFSSRRPRPAGGAPGEDFDIWYVERRGGSWTEPVNLGGPVNTGQNEVNPSVASDGTIYFQRIEKLGTLDWDLYRSSSKDGAYGPPEKLPAPVNTEANEAGPFIAPDGSYLLFQSNRPGSYGIMDIYVTYPTGDGGWSEPANLGETVNTRYSDWGPVVSPDGQYLFFGSFRNIEPIVPESLGYLEYMTARLGAPSPGKGTLYWMEAKIIDALRPEGRPSRGRGAEPQGPPPGSFKMLAGKSSTTVPFDIIKNHVIIRARVNGKEIRLAVDSGLGVDGACLFGGPEIEGLGLTFVGQASVGGAGEGEMVPAKFSTGNTINLPGLDLTEQTLVVLPPDPARALLFGHEDGAIGGSLFNHLAVEIDFDMTIMRLSENKDFAYSGPGQKLKITRLSDGAPLLSGSVEINPGASIPLDFVVDLGASHALSLNTTTNENIKIPKGAIESSLGHGIQGEVMGHVGRVAAFRLGGFTLKDVVTSFNQSESLAKLEGGQGNVGLGILKRFNIIFDYAHDQIILRPNRQFKKQFEFNMSGIGLRKTEDQRYRVARLVPDSPGAAAGILVNDIVTAINGVPADKVSQDSLEDLLRRKGRVVAFTVERAGKVMEFKVRLRRIV